MNEAAATNTRRVCEAIEMLVQGGDADLASERWDMRELAAAPD